MKPKLLDTNTATIGGFWFGVAGFMVGVISTAIAVYTIRSADPNFIYISLSGWIACVIVTITVAILGLRIVRYALDLDEKLMEKVEELANSKNDNQKLLEINSYIVSKAVKQTRARTPASPSSSTFTSHATVTAHQEQPES